MVGFHSRFSTAGGGSETTPSAFGDRAGDADPDGRAGNRGTDAGTSDVDDSASGDSV